MKAKDRQSEGQKRGGETAGRGRQLMVNDSRSPDLPIYENVRFSRRGHASDRVAKAKPGAGEDRLAGVQIVAEGLNRAGSVPRAEGQTHARSEEVLRRLRRREEVPAARKTVSVIDVLEATERPPRPAG